MDSRGLCAQIGQLKELVKVQREAGLQVEGPLEMQVQSLCSQIAALRSCSTADATHLTSAISDGPFTPTQMQTLGTSIQTRSMQSASQAQGGGAQGREQQFGQYFMHYFLQGDWDMMTSKDTEDGKIEVLCERAHKWGVSCPSEDLQGVLAVSVLVGAIGEKSPPPGRIRGLMKVIQKELKRLDKLRRHPLPHMPKYPRNPMELPQDLVEMACRRDQPAKRGDIEAVADKILNGPKFKRGTASSYKDSSSSGGGQPPDTGAIVPTAPATPGFLAAPPPFQPFQPQQAQQIQQMQHYCQLMMMMQQQVAAAANGGVNLTYAPGFGGVPPTRPDVGAKARAPGTARGGAPAEEIDKSDGADEEMPEVEGDPLAELNDSMKKNIRARKDLQPEKRQKVNKASEVRKAAKKNAGSTGGDAAGEDDDTDEEGRDEGPLRRKPAGARKRPAAAKPAAASAACVKPHPKKGSKRYKEMNAYASRAYSAKLSNTGGDREKAKKAYRAAIAQWKAENP